MTEAQQWAMRIRQAIANTEPESTSPQVAPIVKLHRHPDGYIAFATKSRDGVWLPRVSIRVTELTTYFPQFVETWTRDSYVSINAGYRLAKPTITPGKHFGGYLVDRRIGQPKHTSADMRYLCAVHCDLDHYRLGIDIPEAMFRIVHLQQDGTVPPASIILQSGRGIWLLWLLCDPKEPDLAPRAFPDKMALYRLIQDAICARLAELGSDPQAKSVAKYVRVPGSLHSETGEHVQWWIQGRNGAGYSYTLEELRAFFGVQLSERPNKIQRAFDQPKRKGNYRRGWEALNARRLRNFDTLRNMRGGFREGCRNRAALLYAWILRSQNMSGRELTAEVERMGSECHPPLSPAEVRNAVKEALATITEEGKKRWKYSRIQDQTIADSLGISPEEVACLENMPTAMQFQRIGELGGMPIAAPFKPRPPSRAERHQAMLELLNGKPAPSCRRMAELLRGRGFPVRHAQVNLDYQALGIKSRRTLHREAHAAAAARQGRLIA